MMKKLISLAAFKEKNPDNVIQGNLLEYAGGSSMPMESFTIEDSSTDLGPEADTDCQTDFIFDSGNKWTFISY